MNALFVFLKIVGRQSQWGIIVWLTGTIASSSSLKSSFCGAFADCSFVIFKISGLKCVCGVGKSPNGQRGDSSNKSCFVLTGVKGRTNSASLSSYSTSEPEWKQKCVLLWDRGGGTGKVDLSGRASALLWALSQEGVKFKVQGLFSQCRLLELRTERMKTFNSI